MFDLPIGSNSDDVIQNLSIVVAVIHANIFPCNGLVFSYCCLSKSGIGGYFELGGRIRGLRGHSAEATVPLRSILAVEHCREERLFREFDLI